MRIIPVLDILNGVVVHGVAGKRDRYLPIKSVLTSSRDPSVVLNVIREQFSLTSFYLADLDAIQFCQLNRCVLAELLRSEVSVIVDAGIRSEGDVEELLDLGASQVVVALESLPSLAAVDRIISSFDSEQLIFGLDLKGGQPLTADSTCRTHSPWELAKQFCDVGFTSMIVLDLAAVGMNEGIPTLELCCRLRRDFPSLTLVTGGGVSCVADLQAAEESGVDGLLVASALHSGQLTPSDLQTGQMSP